MTRSFLLTPMFVTPIAVGLTFRFLLNQQLGPVPAALDSLGISIDFFGPSLALATIIAIDVWQWTPFMVLLLLAGLADVAGGLATRVVWATPSTPWSTDQCVAHRVTASVLSPRTT